MIKTGSLFFFFLFLPLVAWGELRVEGRLFQTNYEVGDELQYEIAIISSKKMTEPGEEFKPPEIKGLSYLGSSEGASTSIRIVNLKKESTYTKTITLSYACEKEGDYTFPAVDVDLENLRTQAYAFKIYKELPAHLKSKTRRHSNNPLNIFDNFFNMDPRGRVESPSGSVEFFTDVEVSKTEIYKGEQFFAAWYIYISPGTTMTSFDTLRFPTLKGFWKEDVAFASRFDWAPVQKNGKRYMRSLLSSYALTPYKAGDHTIDEFELRAKLASGIFNSNRKVFKVKNNPIKIKVLPLPQPVPETFSGGVGRFVTSGAKEDKTIVFQGAPYSFQIKVIGDRAATKFVKEPQLETGDDFSLYSTKEDYRFVPQKISSITTFRYKIIPKKLGLHQIPDVKLTFFDPESKSYYDRYVKLPLFKVLENSKAPKISDESYQENIKPKVEHLTYLDKRRSLFDFIFYTPPLSFVFTFLFIVLAIALFLFRKASSVDIAESFFVEEMDRRLKKVKSFLGQKQLKEALDELINLYSRMLGAVSGKRFGVEEDFDKAVLELPQSLKGYEQRLRRLNKNLQNLRFNSDLEKQEKQVKLQECLSEFKEVYSTLRSYFL